MKRWIPLILIIFGIAAVYLSGAYHYLTFESLRAHNQELQAFSIDHPLLLALGFILTYIVMTALSIPGAVFLTLLGGYLFPLPLSTIYVVFSATCGACLLFLSIKTAIGNSLKNKAGPFLKKMEKGFQENAVSYLLFLRFVPLFPFWAVNIAAAVFRVPLKTFIWTTVVGIIPGSFVYTLSGRGLGEILETQGTPTFGEVFNLKIKLALVLLGVLSLVPILIKKFTKKTRSK